MTAQIDDIYMLNGRQYSIAGMSGEFFFDPEMLGLQPIGACTACYRGFQVVLGTYYRQLVVKNLYVSLFHDDEKFERIQGPVINGITPTNSKKEYDMFNNLYMKLNYPLEYTGGLLIAADFIDELYVHMGFHPPWKYRKVWELLFEEGKLIDKIDRSPKMAEARNQYLAVHNLDDCSPYQDQKVMEFIEDAFDRHYYEE